MCELSTGECGLRVDNEDWRVWGVSVVQQEDSMSLHPLAYQREAERCEHLARLTLAQDRGAVRCAARLRKLARVMRMKAEDGL